MTHRPLITYPTSHGRPLLSSCKLPLCLLFGLTCCTSHNKDELHPRGSDSYQTVQSTPLLRTPAGERPFLITKETAELRVRSQLPKDLKESARKQSFNIKAPEPLLHLYTEAPAPLHQHRSITLTIPSRFLSKAACWQLFVQLAPSQHWRLLETKAPPYATVMEHTLVHTQMQLQPVKYSVRLLEAKPGYYRYQATWIPTSRFDEQAERNLVTLANLISLHSITKSAQILQSQVVYRSVSSHLAVNRQGDQVLIWNLPYHTAWAQILQILNYLGLKLSSSQTSSGLITASFPTTLFQPKQPKQWSKYKLTNPVFDPRKQSKWTIQVSQEKDGKTSLQFFSQTGVPFNQEAMQQLLPLVMEADQILSRPSDSK